MRRRLVIFLSAILLSLLVVPAINIFSAPSRDAIKWKMKAFLYNMDFVSGWTARILYPLGISLDPKQVVIGYDDWLYLGDLHKETRSVYRQPPTSAEIMLGKQIGAATEAWNVYLSSKGVKLFRIMIGPNKESIYPEYLPGWAKSVSPNATDVLLAEIGSARHIDLRAPLLAAKGNQPDPLYYKTDTHWNMLGGGLAFQRFAQQVAAAAPELRWPDDSAYKVNGVSLRTGGDLANFLRLKEVLADSEPSIYALALPVETVQYDFDMNQVIHRGGNPPVGAGRGAPGSPLKPLLVRSEGALNNRKVLWLRDSFGTSMSPLMAATFSEVLQINWREGIRPGGRFIQLVEDWKPDYVFFTVVERDAWSTEFTIYPPALTTP